MIVVIDDEFKYRVYKVWLIKSIEASCFIFEELF
jgi:hypothetical protein